MTEPLAAATVRRWRATVLTLFPELFPGPLAASLAGEALSQGLWALDAVDIREFGTGPAPGRRRYAGRRRCRHGHARRRPRAPPSMPRAPRNPEAPRIYLSPRGELLTQAIVRELAAGPGVLLLAGRFEGIDERVIAARGLREISIGDYVLAGGELAAMVLIDAVVRLLPGVVGTAASLHEESFEAGLLEYPQYTRPREWEGAEIPRRAALRRPQAHRRVAAHRGRADHPRAPAGSLARARRQRQVRLLVARLRRVPD